MVRQSLSIVLFLVGACDLTWAMEVPLPRAKSVLVASSPSVVPVPEVLPLHDAEAWPSDCALRLAEIARFAHQPTINGPGQCGASDVVRLEGILMPNRALVTVTPAATLRCPIAEAVAQWVLMMTHQLRRLAAGFFRMPFISTQKASGDGRENARGSAALDG
jgi:hypothetical protein